MRIDLPCCGFKNCRHCFDGNCTKPSEQEKCEYWYLLHEEQNKPEPHWIPTSKERPPQHQEIWITDDFGDVELVYGKDGIWLLDESYYTEPEIIAWMPANVPEPYQPEEESE